MPIVLALGAVALLGGGFYVYKHKPKVSKPAGNGSVTTQGFLSSLESDALSFGTSQAQAGVNQAAQSIFGGGSGGNGNVSSSGSATLNSASDDSGSSDDSSDGEDDSGD